MGIFDFTPYTKSIKLMFNNSAGVPQPPKTVTLTIKTPAEEERYDKIIGNWAAMTVFALGQLDKGSIFTGFDVK